jgi:hypothetical protein
MSCYAPVVEAADCPTIGVKLGPIMRALAPSINPVESNPPSASIAGKLDLLERALDRLYGATVPATW